MAIYKNKDINVNVNEHTVEFGDIGANFYTEDKSTSSIRITIKNNNRIVDLSKTNMKPKLDLLLNDGSIFIDEKVDIVLPEQGIIQYKISDQVIKHIGKVNAKLFLKDETKSVHVANFNFTIKDSGIEGVIEKEITVNLVDDTVRRIIQDNAIDLLGEDFQEKLNQDVVTHLESKPELFKGPNGDSITVKSKRTNTDGNIIITFSDNTSVEIPKGLDGKNLRFTDLTPSQKLEIKGDNGKPLTVKSKSINGSGNIVVTFSDDSYIEVPKGKDGKDLKFSDLTVSQKQEIKGEPFKYSDFTDEQLEELKFKKDTRSYTTKIKAIAPFDKLNITAIYNGYNVVLNAEGSLNGDLTSADTVIAKIPPNVPYPNSTIRGALLNVGAGSTDDLQANFYVSKNGNLSVKFRKARTGVTDYIGASLSYAVGDVQSEVSTSTINRVYDFPDMTVNSIQGADSIDNYFITTAITSGSNATQIQVIDINNTSNNFTATITGGSIGHANSMRAVSNNNGVVTVYTANMYEPTLNQLTIDCINKTATVTNNTLTLKTTDNKNVYVSSIDSIEKVGSNYIIHCFYEDAVYRFTVSNISGPSTLVGELMFKLTKKQKQEDRLTAINDVLNKVNTDQSNLLLGNKYYVIQTGYNSTVVMEYNISNGVALYTGKYYYFSDTTYYKIEGESLISKNGKIYITICDEKLNQVRGAYVAELI